MWKLFLVLLFIPSLVQAQPRAVGAIGFGGGLNLQTAVTNIEDDESPDMCNMVTNLDGSASKRFGSEPYINQPLSSQPVSGLFRAYSSSGADYRSIVLAIIDNRIVFSSNNANPVWVNASTYVAVTANQNWSFVQWENDVIFTGDKLTDNIKRFNIINSSLTDLFSFDNSSETVNLRAKYLVKNKNYLGFLNVSDITNGTTFYPSRFYYSYLNRPSSVSWNRYEEFRTGEEITGGGVMFDNINVFFPSFIHDIDFTILAPNGNQVLGEVVNGFGLTASQSLENIGQFYVLGSQDGVRLWDGGRRSRLNVSEENRVISGKIKTLTDKLIKKGTYRNIVGKYYKRREWYVLSYEDPDKFPKGRNNSMIAYDLRLDRWYPLCGLLAQTLESFDGERDKGELIYGSSMDGIVHFLDIEKKTDDSPKQIVLDVMDSTASWKGTNINRNALEFNEGTASVRMWVRDTVTESSITIVKVLNAGEWYDKTKITKDDKLHFELFITSVQNITNLRIDFEVNDVESAFDTNFTSVTISSAALGATNTTWSSVEVVLSSFPIKDEWTSLTAEDLPFANTLTFYGMRFVVTGIGISSVSIDNVRIVQAKENPVNFYRFTKLFDFNQAEFKSQGEVLLTLEKSPDSILKMDIYNDFGKIVRSETVDREIPRELIVFGYETSTGITVLDDIDFSVIRSSRMEASQYFPSNGCADKKSVYFSDRTGNRIVKIDRDNFSVVQSSFGGLGSGTTNFNVPHQMKLDEKDNIYLTDSNNNRIKVHLQSNLTPKKVYGVLGTNTTNFHIPAGLSYNDSFLTVCDEGNFRLVRLDISTFGFKFEKETDFNMAAECSLQEDENNIYMAYNKISDEAVYFMDLFLESRSKSDYNLINRKRITPDGTIAFSTYPIIGNIALRGRYIYITFADSWNLDNARFFIQKRLKSDFSLVKEKVIGRRIWGAIADPFPYKPLVRNETVPLKVVGRYIQLKFYDEGLDNNIRLINHTYIGEPQPLKYSNP